MKYILKDMDICFKKHGELGLKQVAKDMFKQMSLLLLALWILNYFTWLIITNEYHPLIMSIVETFIGLVAYPCSILFYYYVLHLAETKSK